MYKKYIIVEQCVDGSFKISYVYYGNILSGLRTIKKIKEKSNQFNYVKSQFEKMRGITRDESNGEGIREILRRTTIDTEKKGKARK
ncbi:MAG TPA: hypothetical protein VMX17_14430 [Candidatus Glassbacteria bacterium]|nr:hypothetical protein [Candidatus Glassbacteria bacterium]